jgi:ABC-type polysaccharide/polyol phosphate export permease
LNALTIFPLAIKDVANSLGRLHLVLFLAIGDVQARYRRSAFGPIWLTLSTALGSLGLGFLWSKLMRINPAEFVPSLTAGLILWQFIAGSIQEGVVAFTRQAFLIRNISLPLTIYPILVMCKQLVNLAHTLPVFFAIYFFLGLKFNINMLLVIPSVFLVTLNLFWLILLLGILGARYRDMEFLVNSSLPLLMFLSPVFYRPNYLPFDTIFIWLNPISYFIELIRQPLLGNIPSVFIWKMNVLFLILESLAALFVFNKKFNRIIFWL